MGETDIFDREAKGVLQIRVARTCSSKGPGHSCMGICSRIA